MIRIENKKTTELSKGELQQILDGFNITFSLDRPLEVMINQYVQNAFGYSWHNVVYDDDKVVGMDVVSDESFVLTVTETGYGRRSPGDEYRQQTRGGKGVTNYKTEKYGKVAALMTVKDEEDIILISSEGIVIRMPADSISLFSRTSKGVRVMRVGESDKLVTVTTAEREAEGEEAEDRDESAAEVDEGSIQAES